MNKQGNRVEEKLDDIKQSLNNLLILELCKAGFVREEIRRVIGSVSNAQVSKISSVIKAKNK